MNTNHPAEEKEKLTRNLVNGLLLDAFSDKASDIHLEPQSPRESGERGVMIKYRLDGGLKDIKLLTPAVAEEVILYLKQMAGLSPEVKNIPQKGKIFIKAESIGPDHYDLKLGILPTLYGERIVLSINSFRKAESSVKQGFEILNFRGEDLERVKEIFDKSFGLVFITGTSGSGKTTTCHGALNYILTRTSRKANIISVEDWIAYPMDGIVQVLAQPEIEGQGFYETLKAVIWQDPDVVFVSDVLDRNTARMVSELALTGHVILVQLGEPDVLHALERLKELGLEPYLLASILEGAIAQRLVRHICDNCREEFTPPAEIIEKYFQGSSDIKLYRGKGCKECHQSGYKGRTGIYEIIIPDTELKDAIARGENADKLKEVFEKKGFTLLREKALKYALSGITTIDEALRVSYT